MELWLSIGDFPNYQVSSNGRVRNITTGRLLKPGINKHGYPIVVLSNNGVAKTKTVHRLVADTFYDGCHDGLVVDHLDGNKTNNFIANLDFCTSGENNARAYKLGLKKPVHVYEESNNRRVRVVETGIIYRSMNECARETGGNRRHIQDCLNGRLNKHNGYHYEEIR